MPFLVAWWLYHTTTIIFQHYMYNLCTNVSESSLTAFLCLFLIILLLLCDLSSQQTLFQRLSCPCDYGERLSSQHNTISETFVHVIMRRVSKPTITMSHVPDIQMFISRKTQGIHPPFQCYESTRAFAVPTLMCFHCWHKERQAQPTTCGLCQRMGTVSLFICFLFIIQVTVRAGFV